MRRLVENPKPVLALGLLVTAIALWPASRLAVETDPTTLMPSGSADADDYKVFLQRFGGFEKVFVMVTARADSDLAPADLIEAADVLATRLADSSEVATARAGLEDEDLEFLRRYVVLRAPLLLGADWRAIVEDRIAPEALRRRAARIRRGATGPPASPTSLLLGADPLGFSDELPGFRMRPSGLPLDPMTGGFLSPDGSAALVVATPTRTEIDPEGGRALAAALENAYRETRETIGRSLEFLAVGGPLYAAEDESLIKRDVRGSLAGSAVGCLLLLIAAFGGMALPLVALAAVGLGLIWTAAGLGLTIGAVTAAGLGFSAVLLGLGIDYGIHGAARYRQRLLGGESRREAMAAALAGSGPGILTSALTTGGAFAVLAFAHFRPLRELGWLVAVGIGCILLTSATIGAPLALLTGGRRSTHRPGPIWRWLGAVVDGLTRAASARALGTLALLALASGAALWGVTRLTLDSDLRVFRSTDHSALAAEPALLERFGVGLETLTIVASGADLSAALEKAEELEHLVAEAAGPEVRISSLSAWLTGGAASERRLAALRELPLIEAADGMERELVAARLDPEYFRSGLEALRELGHGRDPGTPPREAWPEWLAELVRVEDRTYVALRVRATESRWPEGPPAELVERIRSAGGRVASASLVGDGLRRLASADLRSLGGLAFGVVVSILLLSFRGHVGQSALALVPVLLGGVWALGLWGALGRPLDLVTLAVLPIILGIGLDDGLHALHALRRHPERGVVAALGEAGRAMVLTTATTCVAFGSLAATSVPGLRNAGLLVTVGVLGCLLATLVALPALEAFRLKRPGS